jgi:hypothetical protein
MFTTRRQLLTSGLPALLTSGGVLGEIDHAPEKGGGPGSDAPVRRLALLLGSAVADIPMEDAPANDVWAIQSALIQRGFKPDQILNASGAISKSVVSALLGDAYGRIKDWISGELLLYYSGHGDIDFAAARPEPMLRLVDGLISWRTVFASLAAPPGVRITLLPDC